MLPFKSRNELFLIFFFSKKTFSVFCYSVFIRVLPCHNAVDLNFFYARAITLQLKCVGVEQLGPADGEVVFRNRKLLNQSYEFTVHSYDCYCEGENKNTFKK